MSTSFNPRPLFIAVALCTMTMMAFVALIGPIARALSLAEWQAGATVSVAGALWMLLAHPWGVASDRRGRRFVLLAGMLGFALMYVVLVVFLQIALLNPPAVLVSFLFLVAVRGTIGGFYAAIPATANALIADHHAPERRASAMAALGAANAVGLVLGPALAALLTPFGLGVPLYATLLLPLLALMILASSLPRHIAPVRDNSTAAPAPLRLLDPRLRLPMLIAFLAMFCVAVAQITVGFYALDRLGLPAAAAARAAGIALAVVGFALIGAQLTVRRLGWPPLRLIRSGAVVAAIGFGSCAFAGTAPLLWAGYFVAAAGMGLVFPAFSALAANAVAAHEQGAAAGSISAAQGFGTVLGPIAGTVIYTLQPEAPYLLSAALLLLMAAIAKSARANP